MQLNSIRYTNHTDLVCYQFDFIVVVFDDFTFKYKFSLLTFA